MRFFLCVTFILMSTHIHAASAVVEDLSWMVGSWKGKLGPMTVEETWGPAKAGTLSTMIRLSQPDAIEMFELIVIREDNDSLILHLRQFSPALELRTNQDMPMHAIADKTVSFRAGEGAAIKQLTYTRNADDQLTVNVTVANGAVVTAELKLN
jgi:hypothetical protein